MTRPTYDLQELTIQGANGSSGFQNLWSNHNTGPDGNSVQQPRFIDMEAPGPGDSTRSLPSDKRTTPLIYVHDESPKDISYNDITHQSQDYVMSVRLVVIVAEDMDGRTGKKERNAVIHVLENIREANNAPDDGVFNSEYQSLTLLNIDFTPTEYTNQWRAWYDIEYEAFGVI